MIYRYLFYGYSEEPEKVKLKENKDCYLVLSNQDNWVFLYVESHSDAVDPDMLAEGPLKPFPDGIRWDRANEIYHYSKPLRAEQWNRKLENKRPYLRFGRLNRDKIPSYIYLHYQLQEEKPGDGNRYGVIFMFRDYLFFYSEMPMEKETDPPAPTLFTNQCHRETWGWVIPPHFKNEWVEIFPTQYTEFINF